MEYMHTKIAIGLFSINLIILIFISIFSFLSIRVYDYEYSNNSNIGRGFIYKDILFFISLSPSIFLINFLFLCDRKKMLS